MKLAELNEELKLIKGEWGKIPKWGTISKAEKQAVGDELTKLNHTAFDRTQADEGGGYIATKTDINVTKWIALDWDSDDDIDATIFYRKPKPYETWRGYKIRGIGHDDKQRSITEIEDKIVELLNKSGWWIEATGSFKTLLKSKGCIVVDDVAFIRKLFDDPNIEMDDKISFRRVLPVGALSPVTTVFGKPVLK